MKRKLSVIVLVAMLAVVCLGTLVACKAGLSSDSLTILLKAVETQANKGHGKTSYSLDREVKFQDSDGSMIKCAVEWDTNNESVTLNKGSETVEVTVGTGVTIYNLIGTLVNGSGKPYDIKGNPVYVPISVNGGSNQGNQGGNNQGGNNQGGSTTKTVKEQFLSQVVTAPQAGTNYALAMYYGVPDAVYYAKANVTSFKLDSTTTASEAAVATVEAAFNGYYIKLGGQYLNITSRTSGSKTYYNISLDSSATTVFTIDSNGVLLGAVDEDTYYIGTYQNGTNTQLYTAMGASWSGHLTSEGNTIDVNQFPARLIPSNATITGGNTGNTGNTGNQGTTNPPATDGTLAATMSVASAAELSAVATHQGGENIYSENGINLTNACTKDPFNPVNDQTGEAETPWSQMRLYANSISTVTYTSAFKKIVIKIDSGYKSNKLTSSDQITGLPSGATATVANGEIIIVFNTPVTTAAFTVTAQLRAVSVQIYC